MKKLISSLMEYAPHVDTHYRIGMRVIKTSVAVMLCLALSTVLKSGGVMQISAISALVTLRSSQHDTLHTGAFRILGTVIGGVFGMLTVLIGLFLPYYSDGLFIIVVPLMLIVTLFTCNVLKLQDSCSIACVVLLLVATLVNLESTVGEALIYTAYRIRDTLIGVTVSSLLDVLPLWKVFSKTQNGAASDTDTNPQ